MPNDNDESFLLISEKLGNQVIISSRGPEWLLEHVKQQDIDVKLFLIETGAPDYAEYRNVYQIGQKSQIQLLKRYVPLLGEYDE